MAFAVSVALLLSLVVLAAGCSSGSPGQTTTTSLSNSSTSATQGSTTTTLPMQLSDRERDLAKTSRTQNELTGVLRAESAPDNDPRRAIIYGLHARAQALGCLQMLDKGDSASLDTADGVMLDIYHLLNLARNVATGTVADTLAAARAIADKIGAPSNHVGEAKDLLEQFIEASAPLIDQASALIPSTTTT